jgi:hypothetical protein
LFNGASPVAPGQIVPYASLAAGQLQFVPQADLNSTTTSSIGIRFQVMDSGGTANGGSDLDSAPNSLSINIAAVNDAPKFTGSNVTATDEDGARNIPGWAAPISLGGTDEAAQQLNITVSTDNPDLFTTTPSLDPDGTLRFTPKPNVSGSAAIIVTLTDDGGTALGGTDRTQKTFTLEVTKPHAWHNTALPLDVTADGSIVAADALAVINYINAFGSTAVPAPAPPVPPYYDCVPDNVIAPGDALAIINRINAFGPLQSPSPAPAPPPTEAQDLLTLLALDVATQPRRRR